MMQTFYIVQSYNKQKNGKKTELIADTPIQCKTEAEARNRAERFADKKAGVIAASQEVDPDTDEYGSFNVLAHYGELPAGLLERD
ncbi:hypothetical protein [Neisseria sp. Ec49-e6-T10]|uniref:hypothetical protein n=1 Tax=Neisseria sp. Ec49-e6-T10 TaxID=3140744 RepID=UPI003EC0F449